MRGAKRRADIARDGSRGINVQPPDTFGRNIGAANSAAISNTDNTTPSATRFARRSFSNLVMWLSNFAIVAFLWGGEVSLGKLWWGLSLFMGVQVLASLGRVLSGTGPFTVLRGTKPI